MKSAKITIPVTTFRKIDVPGEIMQYYAVVSAEHLEDVEALVPFDFRLIGKPITLQDYSRVSNKHFFFLDGITLLVKNVKFDNVSNVVTFDYEDPSIHGIIQGMDLLRHIYIMENKKDVFIKLELIEGIQDADDVVEISYARHIQHKR